MSQFFTMIKCEKCRCVAIRGAPFGIYHCANHVGADPHANPFIRWVKVGFEHEGLVREDVGVYSNNFGNLKDLVAKERFYWSKPFHTREKKDEMLKLLDEADAWLAEWRINRDI